MNCYYHPDRDAVTTCSKCGQPICSECSYVTGTKPMCRTCWDKQLSETKTRAPATPSAQEATRPPPGERTAALTGTPQYAGFWRRLGAYFIDYFVTAVPLIILAFAFGITAGITGMMGGAESQADSPWSLATMVIIWLYFAIMESSSKQATLGKMALGMVVTDTAGNRISFARASGRYFAKILSALIFCIGFIMIGFTARKQGLHDMIAGTLVIMKR